MIYMTENINVKKEVNEHITAIREAKIREAGKRETAYLQITTGSLVISVSFIAISGFNTLSCKYFLIAAWVVLLIAIILRLLAFTFVDLSFKKNEEDVREWIKAGMPLDNIPDEKNKWTKIIQYVNMVSTSTTILGLILLVLFGINNLLNMSDDNKKVTGTESNVPAQKHAEPTISAPSLSDRLSTTTPASAPAAPSKQDEK
jgi:hypothetical protein